MKKWEFGRFVVILVLIFILYSLAIGRLFYWQVIKAEELREMGRRQSSESIEIPAVRGQILTNDNFPIATNTLSYLVYSNPKVIEDKNMTAERLADILGFDSASISATLNQDLFWVRIASKVSPEKKRAIEDLALPGVDFQQEYTRFYPEASSAAHLIGFTGRDENGFPRGYFGIEGKYNEQLSGRDGTLYAIKDALGNQVLTDIRQDNKIDGRNIRLTVDRTLQYMADQRLKDGIESYEAEGGTVIIMESATGKILAMSSYPNFDPGLYYEFDPSSYANPAISGVYEPGSTFKVLVMAAALDAGVVRTDTKCDICDGPVKIGEYSIRTWNNKYYPGSSMQDVIVHSDNTGMVFMSQKLGIDKMRSYFDEFGLDSPTGIDLQGEASGSLDNKTWYPIDVATASFGQGISITPLQLINAVNAIANRGQLMQPYVVEEIRTSDGEVLTIKPKVIARPISEISARATTSVMVAAVNEGESQWVGIDNYRIAGKTGTAQIPVAGRYDPTQTIASFIGFFPADSPKYTMLVLIDRPKTSIYGSETAAPVFFNIARDIIQYKNLPSN